MFPSRPHTLKALFIVSFTPEESQISTKSHTLLFICLVFFFLCYLILFFFGLSILLFEGVPLDVDIDNAYKNINLKMYVS